MTKEAMKLALEALKRAQNNLAPSKDSAHSFGDGELWDMYADAIKALEEALAKQEQGEPVAWIGDDGNLYHDYEKPHEEYGPEPTPLYTTPQTKQVVSQISQEMNDKAGSGEGVSVKVPEGWKLVPLEPTDVMCVKGGEAVFDNLRPDFDDTEQDQEAAIYIYKQMLAAAPQAKSADAQGHALVTAARKVMEELGTSTDGLQEMYQVLKLYTTPQPCQTCEALARTVMLDQSSHDTTPQQRKPLTDEQIEQIWLDCKSFQHGMRLVEAAHGIKE